MCTIAATVGCHSSGGWLRTRIICVVVAPTSSGGGGGKTHRRRALVGSSLQEVRGSHLWRGLGMATDAVPLVVLRLLHLLLHAVVQW